MYVQRNLGLSARRDAWWPFWNVQTVKAWTSVTCCHVLPRRPGINRCISYAMMSKFTSLTRWPKAKMVLNLLEVFVLFLVMVTRLKPLLGCHHHQSTGKDFRVRSRMHGGGGGC